MITGLAYADTEWIQGDGTSDWQEWYRQKELTLRINLDPVLRTIVCRIAYADFSPRTLSWAIKATRKKTMSALAELERLELIKLMPSHDFEGVIAPASEQARERMRHWADEWCASDDKCDVSH